MSPSFDKNVKPIITTFTIHTYFIEFSKFLGRLWSLIYRTDNKHTPLFLHQKYFKVESSVEYYTFWFNKGKLNCFANSK